LLFAFALSRSTSLVRHAACSWSIGKAYHASSTALADASVSAPVANTLRWPSAMAMSTPAQCTLRPGWARCQARSWWVAVMGLPTPKAPWALTEGAVLEGVGGY